MVKMVKCPPGCYTGFCVDREVGDNIDKGHIAIMKASSIYDDLFHVTDLVAKLMFYLPLISGIHFRSLI